MVSLYFMIGSGFQVLRLSCTQTVQVASALAFTLLGNGHVLHGQRHGRSQGSLKRYWNYSLFSVIVPLGAVSCIMKILCFTMTLQL